MLSKYEGMWLEGRPTPESPHFSKQTKEAIETIVFLNRLSWSQRQSLVKYGRVIADAQAFGRPVPTTPQKELVSSLANLTSHFRKNQVEFVEGVSKKIIAQIEEITRMPEPNS